ncbi:MAG: hypothetical protein AABY87_03885 [bacterium]
MNKGKKSLALTVTLILIVILVVYVLYLSGYKLEGFVYEKF